MHEMMFSAFVLGFLVAIPPGTVTVAAAQKCISYGFRNNLVESDDSGRLVGHCRWLFHTLETGMAVYS